MREIVSDTRQWFANLVNSERDRQEIEWGGEHDRQHTSEDWTLLLAKHIGKLSDEVLEQERLYHFSDNYIHRLVIIAALCSAAAESVL
jgi:hypothetical protein